MNNPDFEKQIREKAAVLTDDEVFWLYCELRKFNGWHLRQGESNELFDRIKSLLGENANG